MKKTDICTTTAQHQDCSITVEFVKKIIVLTSCFFTATGLRELSLIHPQWRVYCVTPEELVGNTFLQNEKADLLITESECFDDALLKTFVKYRSLPDRIIFLTEHYNGGAQHYKTMRGATFITDKSVSLDSLVLLIEKALSYYTLEGDLNPGKHQRARMAECEVLLSLLNGEKPGTVAQRMGITYNAVSRYKMLALKRAGVKNLNEIITGKTRIFVSDFYKSLHST